jgi:hypothetical protein
MFVKEDENLYPNLDYSPVAERTRRATMRTAANNAALDGRGVTSFGAAASTIALVVSATATAQRAGRRENRERRMTLVLPACVKRSRTVVGNRPTASQRD